MIDITKFKTTRVIDDFEEGLINSSTLTLAIDEYHELFLKRKEDVYVPTPGDNVNIMSECHIPRAKIKEYFDDNKIILQKSISKSNIFIHNDFDTFEKYLMMNKYNYLSMPKEDYIKWISIVYSGDILQNEIKEVLFTRSNVVLIKNAVYNEIRGTVKLDFFDDFVVIGNPSEIENCSYFIFKDIESEELFMNGHITSLNCYNQNNILANINSISMDEELYNQVRELCLSKDQANLTVAIEIMANCNYIKSAVYLLLLHKEFSSKLDECRASGHVNFSAFKDFFDISHNFLKLDTIVKTLLKLGRIENNAMEMLKKYSIREYNEKSKSMSFKVEKVVPTFNNLMIGDGDEDLFENIKEEEQF